MRLNSILKDTGSVTNWQLSLSNAAKTDDGIKTVLEN